MSTPAPPSEPDPEPVSTPTEPEERVERLADLMRGLRRRLESYQAVSEPTADDLATWDTVLYTYDDALVALADLLDVEVPPGARDEMHPEQRSQLEAALTDAGIALTGPGSGDDDGQAGGEPAVSPSGGGAGWRPQQQKRPRRRMAEGNPMTHLTFDDVRPLIDGDLLDADGTKVGKIEDIYLDSDTQEPEWALVHTGLLGRKLHYVPLSGASVADGSLQAAYPADQIKSAPDIEPDRELSPEEGRALPALRRRCRAPGAARR